MKDRFWHFYPLDNEKIKELWDHSIFVFDTNVLFNLYRYSPDTSNQFIETIKRFKDRLWMPYQVGNEFLKNRLKVITDEIDVYKSYHKKVDDIYNEVSNINRNPFLSKELTKELKVTVDKIFTEIDDRVKDYNEQLSNDSILKVITEIYDNKIGENFDINTLNEIKKEGEQRYKNLIPPGYEDRKKEEIDKFGDLVIWKEIIKHAEKEQRPIIFITDDSKEDWWLIHSGKTISLRTELLKEFFDSTKQLCYFYKPFQFLKFSNDFLGNKVQKSAINEVKDFKIPFHFGSNSNTIEIYVEDDLGVENVMKYMKTMDSLGYSLSYSYVTEKTHKLSVDIPPFSDIERRFKEKYIPLLDSYNLKLLSYELLVSQ